ncbi:hypothetical protein CHS0354_006777 [Potamilus streckersoni]|uniref:Mab-21-like HhH/H2TH-like domain-containing protein n=1 Tax=Potamilus streckersoni TaxID=2493646 RepID=A0AAE0S853_9BIVA|nr:hypothetical protein CHS0354_006777 [Potamilus streckersoni]
MTDKEGTAYSPKISCIIMGILHKIGVNGRIRKKRREEWMKCEQLLTFWSKKCKGFIFGSQMEGATTPGLNSDIDLVSLTNSDVAVYDIINKEPDKNNYLMVADEDTFPGYYKLVYKPELCFSYVDPVDIMVNHEKRIVFKPSAFVYPLGIIHGPAATNETDWNVPMDCITGMRVQDWLPHANSWMQRQRCRNWITSEDFENFVQKEAFLVPVGNPISSDRYLEWRISFTTIERELMWKLNNTQIGSYVLMKMIIKHFITPAIGECLTSYQCKTTLFWLIENMDKGLWKPQNLLICVDAFLKTVLLWVKGTFCPNYFIPQENMFLGKLSVHKSCCLYNILSNLIDMDFRYLTSIPFDGIGQALSRACSRIYSLHLIPYGREHQLDETQDSDVLCIKQPILWSKRLALTVYISLLKESSNVLDLLIKLIQEYQSCREVLQDDLFVWIKLLYSHFGCQLASSCFARGNFYGQEIETAHMYLQYGESSDVTSGRLRLAGFYLKLGYPALAEEVLTAVERYFKHYVCDLATVDIIDMDDVTIHEIVSGNLTTLQTYRNCLALSVLYLPSEIHCIPPPLSNELFWSVCEFVVVDARPYMYFLQHQTYLALAKSRERTVALENLASASSQKRIRHHEMYLNLLAYCLRQEECVLEGLECLFRSLRIRPEYNGAIWQICDILAAYLPK